MKAFDRKDLSAGYDGFAGSYLWASVVYSAVPFIGIVFVPVTFGLAAAYVFRRRHHDRSLTAVLAASASTFCAQIVLWWLLYLVPEIGL